MHKKKKKKNKKEKPRFSLFLVIFFLLACMGWILIPLVLWALSLACFFSPERESRRAD